MIAKNNIFNIRQGAKWQGMTGTKKGFVEFETRAYALRAWLILMRTYRRRYNCRTVQQIVTRYAPPNENDTEQYMAFCCREVGVSADDELTSLTMYAMLGKAMAKMETGTLLHPNDILEVMNRFQIRVV